MRFGEEDNGLIGFGTTGVGYFFSPEVNEAVEGETGSCAEVFAGPCESKLQRDLVTFLMYPMSVIVFVVPQVGLAGHVFEEELEHKRVLVVGSVQEILGSD